MKRTKQKKASLVRIEPDVAKDVATESKRNGRTVQGEVNSVLRDHYSSKWDTPVSATPAQEAAFLAGMVKRGAIKL